jgi:hypothetical protein
MVNSFYLRRRQNQKAAALKAASVAVDASSGAGLMAMT